MGGSVGVLCYQQNDTVFDTTSNVFMSEIKITRPDGTTTNFTTELFCQRHKAGLSSLAYDLPESPRLDHTKTRTSLMGSVLDVGSALWFVATHPTVLLQGDVLQTFCSVLNDLWRVFSSPSTLQVVLKD